jgi:hypothetical protein
LDKKYQLVMRQRCSTCPFNTDKNGRHKDVALVNKIINRVLNHANQICHHPALLGQKETHLCRGARDYQLDIFWKLGVLEEPTDKAWAIAQAKASQN